jgi:hypothetical protein
MDNESLMVFILVDQKCYNICLKVLIIFDMGKEREFLQNLFGSESDQIQGGVAEG